MEYPLRRWRRWPMSIEYPPNNPYAYPRVEIQRLRTPPRAQGDTPWGYDEQPDKWNTTEVVDPSLLPAEMNVAMLWWRPLQDSPPSKVHHPLPYKMLLFDADGTLRRCTVPGQPCPNTPDEWELLPHVQEILSTHYTVPMAIISNQGGIEAGFLPLSMAWSLLWDCAKAIRPATWDMPQLFVCPHLPTTGCPSRKPSPFLLLKALDAQWEARRITLAECLYVGDMASDAEAAQRAGMAFLWAKDFFQWEP